MADYFAPLARRSASATAPTLPKIFYVNWFRKDERRQVPLARLRREHARARVGLPPLRRRRPTRVETPIGLVPARGRHRHRRPRHRPRRPRRGAAGRSRRAPRPSSRRSREHLAQVRRRAARPASAHSSTRSSSASAPSLQGRPAASHRRALRASVGFSPQHPGDVAEWLRSGLQSRLHRFDSGRRLWIRSTQLLPSRWLVWELPWRLFSRSPAEPLWSFLLVLLLFGASPFVGCCIAVAG